MPVETKDRSVVVSVFSDDLVVKMILEVVDGVVVTSSVVGFNVEVIVEINSSLVE